MMAFIIVCRKVVTRTVVHSISVSRLFGGSEVADFLRECNNTEHALLFWADHVVIVCPWQTE
jgi:hypothetical protein